jgi:hypothetical protein
MAPILARPPLGNRTPFIIGHCGTSDRHIYIRIRKQVVKAGTAALSRTVMLEPNAAATDRRLTKWSGIGNPKV